MWKQGFHAAHESLPQCASTVMVTLSCLYLSCPCIPETNSSQIKKILEEMQSNNSSHLGNYNSWFHKALFRRETEISQLAGPLSTKETEF